MTILLPSLVFLTIVAVSVGVVYLFGRRSGDRLRHLVLRSDDARPSIASSATSRQSADLLSRRGDVLPPRALLLIVGWVLLQMGLVLFPFQNCCSRFGEVFQFAVSRQPAEQPDHEDGQ